MQSTQPTLHSTSILDSELVTIELPVFDDVPVGDVIIDLPPISNTVEEERMTEDIQRATAFGTSLCIRGVWLFGYILSRFCLAVGYLLVCGGMGILSMNVARAFVMLCVLLSELSIKETCNVGLAIGAVVGICFMPTLKRKLGA